MNALKFALTALLITLLLAACTPTREQLRQAYYHHELQSLAGDTSLSEAEKAALVAEAADFAMAILRYNNGEIALDDVPPKPALYEMRDQQRAALEAEASPTVPVAAPAVPPAIPSGTQVAVLQEPPRPQIKPEAEAEPKPEAKPVPQPKPIAQPQPAPQPAQVPQPQPAATSGEYSDWLHLRSDIWSFQYRLLRVEQVGTTARLRLQLRVDETSRDFCTDPRCDGYVATLRYANEHNDSVSLHFRIHPGFSGVYTVPTLLSTSLVTFPDGSSRAYDSRQGVVIFDGPGQPSRHPFISGCLDAPLVGRQHNCRWDFDAQAAQHIR